MRVIVTLILAFTASTAMAQGQQPPPPVALPVDLVNRTISFLNFGGTWNEAAGLRDAILQAAHASQKESEQRRIDGAAAAVNGASKPEAKKPE